MADDQYRQEQRSPKLPSRFMNLPDDPQPAPAPAERRKFVRYTVRVQIEIRPEGVEIPMRLETTDLSRSGCYVQVMMPLPVGMRLQATLWLDGTAIVVRGLVVTSHPQFGNGIMFVDYEGDAEPLLNKYLDAVVV
jgi:hypothetical protein